MKKLLILALLALPLMAHAALYKWVDDNGEVVYSDTPPPKQAEEIRPPSLNVTPAVKYKAKEAPTPEEDTAAAVSYTELKVVSPAMEETVRNNNGTLTVTVSLTPELSTEHGHTIAFLVDGKVKVKNSTSLSKTLTFIERGTHTISAKVKDVNGKTVIASDNVTIHMFRGSKLIPKPAQKKP
jgi:hypothetical protein